MRLILSALLGIGLSRTLLAEGMMGGGSCPMCGAGGWIGVALGIALVAVLIALSLFLIRRSRSRP